MEAFCKDRRRLEMTIRWYEDNEWWWKPLKKRLSAESRGFLGKVKILITGSESMLARDLIPVLKESNEVVPLSRQKMDLTQKDAVIKNIKSSAPDIVINCAAYTKVDMAEEEREKAFQVNAIGVQNLAVRAQRCKFLYVI